MKKKNQMSFHIESQFQHDPHQKKIVPIEENQNRPQEETAQPYRSHNHEQHALAGQDIQTSDHDFFRTHQKVENKQETKPYIGHQESGQSNSKGRAAFHKNVRLPIGLHEKRKRRNGNWYDAVHEPSYQADKRMSHWKSRIKLSSKVFLIASMAAALGVIFGMFMLSLFSSFSTAPNPPGESQSERFAGNTQEEQATEPVEEQRSEQGETSFQVPDPPEESMEQGSDRPASSHIPIRTYYVVQAGVFSEIQAAEEMKNTLIQQGWPSVIMPSDENYRLFVGASLQREEAQQLGEYLEEQGLEIYTRDYTAPALQATGLTEDALQSLQSFFDQGDQLLGMISSYTINRMITLDNVSESDEWTTIQEKHRSLLQHVKDHRDDWPVDQQSLIQRLTQKAATAINALETYKGQQHPSYLWQSQQAVLHYIADYQNGTSE